MKREMRGSSSATRILMRASGAGRGAGETGEGGLREGLRAGVAWFPRGGAGGGGAVGLRGGPRAGGGGCGGGRGGGGGRAGAGTRRPRRCRLRVAARRGRAGPGGAEG